MKNNKPKGERILSWIITSQTIFVLGMMILMLGSTMNYSVVIDNGGKMPVLSDYSFYETSTHFTYESPEDVCHPQLTDQYHLGEYIYSLGDFFIYFGLGVIFISLLFSVSFTIYYLVYDRKRSKVSQLGIEPFGQVA